MGAFVPFTKKTVEDESGFADATGAVDNERLMDTMVLGVVIEDCL